jgi:hypothetical protein
VFREAGTQISPVTMSCPSLRTSALPGLLLFIKGWLKEGLGILAFGFWGFTLGFWAFGLFVWHLEGRRIIEEKKC